MTAEIHEKQSKVAELSKDTASMWNNHKLADLREAFSDQMLGMSLIGNQHPEFFLKQSGSYLRGSVLAMMLAAGKDDSEAELYEYVIQKEERLSAGDMTAYDELKSKINELRLESAGAINAIGKNRLGLESQIRKLESRREFVRILSVSLSLLGLVLVMLKDLPVWKR